MKQSNFLSLVVVFSLLTVAGLSDSRVIEKGPTHQVSFQIYVDHNTAAPSNLTSVDLEFPAGFTLALTEYGVPLVKEVRVAEKSVKGHFTLIRPPPENRYQKSESLISTKV